MQSDTNTEFQALVPRTSLFPEEEEDARKVLATKICAVRGEGDGSSDIKMVEFANIRGIIFPWTLQYRLFFWTTVVGAIFTVFFAPFQIAFEDEPGTFTDAAGWIELCLNLLFTVDIFVHFNLAFYQNGVLVFERKEIFQEYFGGLFWVDFVGVFPFETVALLLIGELGETGKNALLLSLLRLVRFVRLHRMGRLSEALQYDARVPLYTFTLLRNFAVVVSCAHTEACCMYFLARLNNFGEHTWLGPLVQDMTGLDRYVTALYLAIVSEYN